MRIYLDNCCFNRPFDEQDQLRVNLESQAKLYIQEEILNNRYELVWSFVLSLENQENPFEERRIQIAEWKRRATYYCDKSVEISELGKKITELYGLKAKDALHVSCAIISECDYFITTDKGILKKNIADIRVIDPIDFIKEV